MKIHLLFLVILVVAPACTIIIQTNQTDIEATERYIEKSTLQALKDKRETEVAQNQKIESPDETQPPNEEQSPDASIPSQGTQVPPTVPPPDISDVLLPTADFEIFASQTPIVPPKISADQGKLPVIPTSTPTRTPKPFAGGSLISFDVYGGCGRYLTIQFHVNNQSTIPLESAYVTCHNVNSTEQHYADSNAPFHSSPNECAPGAERIKAGTNSYIVVYMGNERMNSGEEFYCYLTVSPYDLPCDLSGVPVIYLTSPVFTAP